MDGPVFGVDGLRVVRDEGTTQDDRNRHGFDDEKGHRDDQIARLTQQRDGTADALPCAVGVLEAYLLFGLQGEHEGLRWIKSSWKCPNSSIGYKRIPCRRCVFTIHTVHGKTIIMRHTKSPKTGIHFIREEFHE